jgi:hypothetical protein
MPCVCDTCAQHARTLGLAGRPSSNAAIHKAFRAAAKLWHPDRFENDAVKRLEAEERFKQIQIACRELLEHFENPAEWFVESVAVPAAEPAAKPAAKVRREPAISFGGAPGCFTAPDFPLYAERIIAEHNLHPDRALAIVDLSGAGSTAGSFAQYFLLTIHGIFVRDDRSIVSLLWYTDLGAIYLVDLRKHGKLGIWQSIVERISGTEQKYALEICRKNGEGFCSIVNEVDDSVKKVIYSFLVEMKPQSRC